ncbi:hypothetical protein ACFOGG_03520 [Brenneria rubrifaciens]|uniref:hypothetical protein n=1 Tax=Brenneria rubrifaciens TaxID=55213 RepID=UPI003616A359
MPASCVISRQLRKQLMKVHPGVIHWGGRPLLMMAAKVENRDFPLMSRAPGPIPATYRLS